MSNQNDTPKVPLLTLWQKTSKQGKPYLYGYLGQSKVIAFLDDRAELKFGAEAAFNLFLQAKEPRGEGGGEGYSAKSYSSGVQRYPETRHEPTPDLPGDDLDDLWKEDTGRRKR
jgi:hypothetical protein